MIDHRPDPLQPLPVEQLTWAALLGHWVDLSRAALALPDDDDGRRLKAALPDLIMLQAVWFALQDTSRLPPDQRALGHDRAAILIEKHAGALRQAFGRDLPKQAADLITDASHALEAARATEAPGRPRDHAPWGAPGDTLGEDQDVAT